VGKNTGTTRLGPGDGTLPVIVVCQQGLSLT